MGILAIVLEARTAAYWWAFGLLAVGWVLVGVGGLAAGWITQR